MKIEFTLFNNKENWVEGTVNNGEYTFMGKLFDEGSAYGIDEGRVSKLTISYGKEANFKQSFVNYDRGWDVEPQTSEHKAVFSEVLAFLENAPLRFQD